MSIREQERLWREADELAQRLGYLQEKAGRLDVTEDEAAEMARLTKRLMGIMVRLEILKDVEGEA